MFVQLKPLVSKSPIAMQVVGEGDQLRVTIQQKRSGKTGVPLSLSIVGTPEELDRELPASIATAAGELAKPAPIADQVKAQVQAAASAAADGGRRKAKGGKKTSAKTTKRPKTKPLKQAKTPKHKAKAGTKVRLPGKKKTASPLTPHPSRTPSPDGVKHHASKPGRDACIADYKAMKEKHGDKLNREFFIEKSETGRRFERLWGMSWNKFKQEAESKGSLKTVKVRDLTEEDGFEKDGETLPSLAEKRKTKPATPPARSKAAPSTEGAGPAEGDSPPRDVKNSDGVVLLSSYRKYVNRDQELTIGRSPWIVCGWDSASILVKPKEEVPA
jgi:PRTRC genetic system protein E